MKSKFIANVSKLLLFTLVAGLFAGCAATRPISDVALGAGGVLVSEGLHHAARKQAEKAYATGYDKGKSDAVKQQYWLYVSMQKQRNQVGNVRLYPVQLPEQRIDGVVFQPTAKYLRIEE